MRWCVCAGDFGRCVEDVWVHRQGWEACATGVVQRQHGPAVRPTDVRGCAAWIALTGGVDVLWMECVGRLIVGCDGDFGWMRMGSGEEHRYVRRVVLHGSVFWVRGWQWKGCFGGWSECEVA
jgi:hypothetical protein